MSRRGRSMIHGGAVIKDDLPPLAARYSSTYGADVNYAIYNPMKGKRKDLKSAIEAALRYQDDDDDAIDKQLMEEAKAKRNRKEAPRESDDAEAEEALQNFQRRERVIPTNLAEKDAELKRQVAERKKTLRRKQGIISEHIMGPEATPDRVAADQQERQRQEELTKAAAEEDKKKAAEARAKTLAQKKKQNISSEYQHLTPDQQEIISRELQRQGQVLYEAQHQIMQGQKDGNLDNEEELYKDATFLGLIKRFIGFLTRSVFNGTLGLFVIAFWAAFSAWMYQHYTINPALIHWDVSWDHSNGIWENLSQFKPLVPIAPIEWLVIGGNSTDAAALHKFQHELARQQAKLTRLEKSTSLNTETREKLAKMLPDVIVVERNGKNTRLPTYLYHAIRDDLKKEGIFFNMGKSHGGKFEISSDAQWDAIIERLGKDGFAKKADLTPAGVTNQKWEEFLRENQRLLEKTKRENPGVVIPPNVVTREQLIDEMSAEFKRTQKNMKTELAAVEKRLEEKLKVAVQAAASSASGATLNKNEVRELVRSMVKQAMTEAQLDTLAHSEIRTDYLSVLRKQINFFSRGAGAVIVPPKSSPTFDYEKGRRKAALKGIDRRIKNTWMLEPAAVLEGWSDDGHCWCGAIGIDRRGLRQGTSVVIQTGRKVIPQQIVVEHILKGATLDDDARPRDIEIWAYIEEVGLREQVQKWSEKQFTRESVDEDGKPIGEFQFNDGFVKIGMFTFPDMAKEAYVQQLSPELLAMGAATDQVRVVATTNYGNQDKTCFYRLRLYGEMAEE